MMTIKQIEVTVGDIVKGYVNNDEQGVRGYDGKLDIRPPYQREFIYNEKEQQAVITTVLKGYPLNVMYWVKRSDDAECPYEVMDGQQRTLSLCEYVDGKFSYDFKNFFNQPKDIQERILNYRLTVYVCEGEASEKLEWFQTINIAGKPLNEQEINNAVYAGPFVTDAKKHFSKSNCGAYRLGKDLVNGTPIRQELFMGTPEKGMEFCGFREKRPTVLVIGGSTGSAAVNGAVWNALDRLLTEYNVIHICGKDKTDAKDTDRDMEGSPGKDEKEDPGQKHDGQRNTSCIFHVLFLLCIPIYIVITEKTAVNGENHHFFRNHTKKKKIRGIRLHLLLRFRRPALINIVR